MRNRRREGFHVLEMGKNEIKLLPLTLTCFHLTWIEGETKYSVTIVTFHSEKASGGWCHHFGPVPVLQYRNAFCYIMSVLSCLIKVSPFSIPKSCKMTQAVLYCTHWSGETLNHTWRAWNHLFMIPKVCSMITLVWQKLTLKFSSDRVEGFKYCVIRCRVRGYPESPKNSPSRKPWLMKIINYHFFKLSVNMAISPNSGVMTWARPSCTQGSFPCTFPPDKYMFSIFYFSLVLLKHLGYGILFCLHSQTH